MALAGNGLTISGLQPWLRPYAKSLLSAAPSLGARSIRITSVKRSRAQQVALYKNFLAGRSRYPVAVPGTSKHERGLAFDIVTEPYEALWSLGAFWKRLGGFWSPNDPIHFETPKA